MPPTRPPLSADVPTPIPQHEVYRGRLTARPSVTFPRSLEHGPGNTPRLMETPFNIPDSASMARSSSGSSALADYLMQRSVEENVTGRTIASLRHSSGAPTSAATETKGAGPSRQARGSFRQVSGDESDDSVLNEEEERLLDTLVAHRQSTLPGTPNPQDCRV